ncbi:unnamed protein product [Protopolystoma xenopodis]|uniref:Uncharacterized protein n=1 Tax=Protopolystoma xenopodis TaxID=117903 RepID=A0A3S5AZM2_9PLAT|nr:unnamed protein product [Protopolystoma xenopodis]
MSSVAPDSSWNNLSSEARQACSSAARAVLLRSIDLELAHDASLQAVTSYSLASKRISGLAGSPSPSPPASTSEPGVGGPPLLPLITPAATRFPVSGFSAALAVAGAGPKAVWPASSFSGLSSHTVAGATVSGRSGETSLSSTTNSGSLALTTSSGLASSASSTGLPMTGSSASTTGTSTSGTSSSCK